MKIAKKTIFGILIAVVLVGILIGALAIYYFTVQGNKEITVSTYEELVQAKGYVKLEKDLDLNYQTIEPIKCETFDGQGHTIKNFIMIASAYTNRVSFFDKDTQSIKNINFEGATIKGDNAYSVSVVKSTGRCSIENVHIKNSKITGNQNTQKPLCVGGIYAGDFKDTDTFFEMNSILNCSAENITLEINRLKTSSGWVDDIYGGAIAAACNSVSNCFAIGCSITANSNGPYIDACIGGAVGYAKGEICNTYASDNAITINATYYEDSIFSYFSSPYIYVGGVLGLGAKSEVLHCYSKGNQIVGHCAGSFYVGGLAGYINEGQVSQSYATSNIISGDNYKEGNKQEYLRAYGGLIGFSVGSTISSCYAYNNNLKENSSVTGAGTSKAGGLCIANSNSSISYCGTYNNKLKANSIDELCAHNISGIYHCVVTSKTAGNVNNCELVSEDFWYTKDSLKNKLLFDGVWKYGDERLPYFEFQT